MRAREGMDDIPTASTGVRSPGPSVEAIDDSQQNIRYRHQYIHKTHNNVAYLTAIKPSGSTQSAAGKKRYGDGDNPCLQRDARTVSGSAENITAGIVSAQQKLTARHLVGAAQMLFSIMVQADKVSKDSDKGK